MKIWVEVELHSYGGYTYHDISYKEKLSYTEFKNVWNGLKVMMSEEYYPTTIEYNFEAHEYSPRYIEKIRDYLQWQIEKYWLVLSTSWPGYVWMHMHIFDLKIRKIWVESLLETTMMFIDKRFDELCKSSKKRLFSSHQLWRNYSYERNDELLDMLDENGFDMSYPDYNQEKKKYNPCILSNRSAKGKPRSIEIRLLANEWLMDNSIVYLLDQIKEGDFVWCNVMQRLQNWMHRYNKESIPSWLSEQTYTMPWDTTRGLVATYDEDTSYWSMLNSYDMINNQVNTIHVTNDDWSISMLTHDRICTYQWIDVYVWKANWKFEIYKEWTWMANYYWIFNPNTLDFTWTRLWNELRSQ